MNIKSENKDALSGSLFAGGNSPPPNPNEYNGSPLAPSQMDIIGNSHRLTIAVSVGLISLISLGALGQKAVVAQPAAPVEVSPEVRSLTSKLSGTWQAKNPITGEILTFIFSQDGKLLVQLPSKSEPTAQELGYRINPKPQPMQLDVLFTGTDQFVKTIFEFSPTGELRLQIAGTDPGAARPSEFGGDATLFKKVSDATTLPPSVQVSSVPALISRQRQGEGKQNINAMSRAQQAYYLENRKFATTISELGLGIKPESENYRYQIVLQGDSSSRVMMTATAKRPELKSYTGAVFVVKNNNEVLTFAGICETDKPSTKPPLPSLPNNTSEKMQCPTGSNQVER